MMMKMRKALLSAAGLWLLWSLVVAYGAAQLPDELAQSPSYQVSGRVGWLVRYGLGDSRGLSQKGYARGFSFSQNISLDADVLVPVKQPIPGLLSLIAHLDNQQPDFLQSLYMRWQAQNWQAQFGDFPMGRPESPFASSSRLLKGFKVDWQLNERWSLSAVLSRVEGIQHSRTFRGNTVEEEITFAFHPPNQPWQEETYRRNLRGLEYFHLGPNYVEGFTKVTLDFTTDARLRELLRGYGLGFLFETIRDDPQRELDSSYYIVIFTDEGYFLALRSEFLSLLRDRVLNYIEDYNSAAGLTGEERREYPLSEGTDYERGFLERLSDFVALKADSLSFAPEEISRQRFYALGRQDIEEASVRVAVRIEEEFIEVNDPRLADYRYRVYPDAGVIEFDFPTKFFENPESAVKVSYAYRAGSGTYMLDISVLKGSERVYLNGELLQSGTDYLIEYETGFLILLREIGSDDVLRVEYEIARGGLGGFSEYRRSFQGITLRYKPTEALKLDIDLLQAYDSPTAGLSKEELHTMPNTHTLLGISGHWEGETLQGDFNLGFNVNRFPPDDNLRANLPDRIYAIHALEHHGRELVLLGHRNGLLVYDGDGFSHYGVAEGLAGPAVYDISTAPGRVALATSGGVSLLKLDPGDPLASFARPANWKSLGEREGLPASKAFSVLIIGETLWVGTDQGLAQAPLDGLDDPESWKVYQKSDHPEMVSDRIFELAYTQSTLYIGTDGGLMAFDPQGDEFRVVEELRGVPIHDLAVDGNVVYAATDMGIRALVGGRGVGWPVADRAVIAVAIQAGELWFGTSEGLYSLSRGLIPETRARKITALGGSEGAIWAGEEATDDYELLLFEVDFPLGSVVRVHSQLETGLSGRAEGRFTDVPASEHTDYGWLGRLAISKQLGPLQLTGALESVSPQFTPVGALERRDMLQLSLSAVYPLSPTLSLSAQHTEGLFELFSLPSQTLRDAIGLSFSPPLGPQIVLDYTLERIDRDFTRPGFDELKRSYALSAEQQLLDERLTLELGYQLSRSEDLIRPLYSFTEGELNGTAAFQALEDLKLHLDYRQPLSWRFGQLMGLGRLDWGADWSTALSLLEDLPLSIQADYRGSRQIPLEGGHGALDQSATALIQAASLNLGRLSLAPQAKLSLNLTDLEGPHATTELSGEGTLQGRLAAFNGQLYYKKSRVTYELSRLERLQDVLRVSLDYGGFPELRPTLEFSGSLETLFHPFFGRKLSGQYQISLDLLWQTTGPLQGSLYLSHQRVESEGERTISYALQQSVQYPLTPDIVPRLEFYAEYLKGERGGEQIEQLNGELSLAGDLVLLENWNATLSGSLLFRLDALKPQGSYESFALTLQFGRGFALF